MYFSYSNETFSFVHKKYKYVKQFYEEKNYMKQFHEEKKIINLTSEIEGLHGLYFKSGLQINFPLYI